MAAFKEPVCVKVNEKGPVEMVFKRDAGIRMRVLQSVEAHEVY